uniref:Uncharacterized protein n=1 Tax=Spongospora subterranea TaxID=70186 RepID=A0A0H5RC93_9EUKA|eukprot:CRZ11222.1 hypothetical protein [Spongospora subterranea]
MNSTFYSYNGQANPTSDDERSSVFAGLSSAGDLDSFLSWDFENEPSSSGAYDPYGASPLSSAHAGSWAESDGVDGGGARVRNIGLESGAGQRHECPTCQRMINIAMPGESMHGHIASCFLERNKHHWRSEGHDQEQELGEKDLSHIQETISHLDLTTRLKMMESLYRLSKSQELVKPDHGQGLGRHHHDGYNNANIDGHGHRDHNRQYDINDPILTLIYANKGPLAHSHLVDNLGTSTPTTGRRNGELPHTT